MINFAKDVIELITYYTPELNLISGIINAAVVATCIAGGTLPVINVAFAIIGVAIYFMLRDR